jgi:hypothetical protein
MEIDGQRRKFGDFPSIDFSSEGKARPLRISRWSIRKAEKGSILS